MPSEILRVSIPVTAFQPCTPGVSRWAGRRIIGALLGIWAAVAALVAAVVIAVVWDLRP